MIELTPPEGQAPFKSFKLHSGLTVFPDFDKGGKVRVPDETDAQELEQEGWTRTAASRHSKAVETDLLRKSVSTQFMRETGVMPPTPTSGRPPSDGELLRRGLAAGMAREPHSIGNADTHQRVEFGRVEHPELGHLQIAHENDGARDWLNIHGVNFEVADRDLRDAISTTAGAFNAAQTAESQRSQVAIVSTIVSEVLRRSTWLHAKIKEVKDRERFTAV